MPVSIERANKHVDAWTTKLKSLSAIRSWPRFLFHAAQAEVVVEILKTGQLIPRELQDHLVHDVANQGAIASNPDALQYARMYFRPKNMFHLKTEGIKLIGDQYRDALQMSVPIMLVFDLKSVLILPSTGFSIGKLAGAFEAPNFTEEFFDTIPFADVYHDAAPSSRGNEIRNHRMSEVVHNGPLEVSPHLKYIVCRSTFDRQTLLHLLGPLADEYRQRIVLESTLCSTFMRKATYISNLQREDGELTIGFHLPVRPPDLEKFTVQVCQYRHYGEVLKTAQYRWPIGLKQGRIAGFSDDADTLWTINVDQVLAFNGSIPHSKSQVF